jgi:hypothetical protein
MMDTYNAEHNLQDRINVTMCHPDVLSFKALYVDESLISFLHEHGFVIVMESYDPVTVKMTKKEGNE